MGFGKADGTSGNIFVAGDTLPSDLIPLEAALGELGRLRLRAPLPPVPPVPPVSSEEANEASELVSSAAAKCTARPMLPALPPPACTFDDGVDTGIDVPESRLSSSSEPSPLTDLLAPRLRECLVRKPLPLYAPGADLTDILSERASSSSSSFKERRPFRWPTMFLNRSSLVFVAKCFVRFSLVCCFSRWYSDVLNACFHSPNSFTEMPPACKPESPLKEPISDESMVSSCCSPRIFRPHPKRPWCCPVPL